MQFFDLGFGTLGVEFVVFVVFCRYADASDDEGDHDDIFLDRKTTCPDCNTKVTNNPSCRQKMG